ncbi:MAG: hypothetical protein OHK0013_45710 [Sandaracinaceae bacterium]
MRLTADTSCTDKRSYRLDVAGVTVAEWVGALESLRSGPQLPGSNRYSVLGHDVLLVERTGRIQVRVALDVAKHDRRVAAERVVAALLRRLLAQREL